MNYSSKAIVVLLIEDKEREREMFLQILKASQTNVSHILTAVNFNDAEQILSTNKPDIIFSSLLPGELTQQEFFNKLKELTILIPFITLSEEADDGFYLSSLAFGADDHLFRNELSGAVLRKSIKYSIERKKIMKN